MRRVLLALPAVLAIIAAVAAPPSAKAAEHTTLTIGITQYPSTFHPSIDSMMAKAYVLGMTRRPITTYGPDWQLMCMLCTGLPTLENGGAERITTPDGKPGMKVTYTLDADARWGDGTPVSVDDVVFTWEVGRHPKTGVGNAEAYRRIYRIEKQDAKTFTLYYDRRTFDYNDISGFYLLPAHLEREKFAEPLQYKHRTTYDSDTLHPGLWMGPYRIAAVETGSHVTLEQNPEWWGEPPHFERITVRVIPNTAALEANLLSGGIDMIAGELGLTTDQALAFAERHGDKFNMMFKPGLVYEHIDLNLDNPILADPKVRRALLHGIDRGAISEKLFAGKHPVAHTAVNPLDTVYADDVPTYGYDPEKAAALLDDAGWREDGRVRRNAEGQPLKLEIMTTAGNRSRELVEQVLQSQWRRIGVEVDIRNEPARVFFGKTVTQREFTGMAMFAWISAPESVPRTTLHSESIATADNNWSGQNYTGYSNPEMDKLIERIELELDDEKRKQLWRELQHLYASDLPVLPLYFRADPYVLPTWLTGVTPTGHQFPSTLWVEDWGVK